MKFFSRKIFSIFLVACMVVSSPAVRCGDVETEITGQTGTDVRPEQKRENARCAEVYNQFYPPLSEAQRLGRAIIRTGLTLSALGALAMSGAIFSLYSPVKGSAGYIAKPLAILATYYYGAWISTGAVCARQLATPDETETEYFEGLTKFFGGVGMISSVAIGGHILGKMLEIF